MDNINPNLWGPSGWKFLHYITLSYPDYPDKTIKETFKNFFINLYKILPCEKCRLNYIDHLKIYPINDNVLKDKESIVKWLINMHNLVNIINNKKEYSYIDFQNEYEMNKNSYNSNQYFVIIFLTILFILLIIIFIKNINK